MSLFFLLSGAALLSIYLGFCVLFCFVYHPPLQRKKGKLKSQSILFINVFFSKFLLNKGKPIYVKTWAYNANACKLCLNILCFISLISVITAKLTKTVPQLIDFTNEGGSDQKVL